MSSRVRDILTIMVMLAFSAIAVMEIALHLFWERPLDSFNAMIIVMFLTVVGALTGVSLPAIIDNTKQDIVASTKRAITEQDSTKNADNVKPDRPIDGGGGPVG